MNPLGRVFKREAGAERAVRKALKGFSLPSFPAVVLKALRQLRNPNTPLSTVASLLELDPKVSARLLQLTNSAGKGFRHKVTSVEHALSLLGRSEVESLLLSVAVAGALPRVRHPAFDPAAFWREATQRALLARKLACALQPGTEGESFTAALLQDMGLPIMLKCQKKRYVPVLSAWQAGAGELIELERSALGFDHTEVAAEMAKLWQFPQDLTDSLQRHHGTGGAYPAAELAAQLPALDEANDGGEESHLENIARLVASRGGVDVKLGRTLLAQTLEESDELAPLLAGG